MNAQGTEETDKIDDPVLLAEILEAREELEEAETHEEIDRIRQANKGAFLTLLIVDYCRRRNVKLIGWL